MKTKKVEFHQNIEKGNYLFFLIPTVSNMKYGDIASINVYAFFWEVEFKINLRKIRKFKLWIERNWSKLLGK